MARRRRKVNISDAIRSYVTEFPDAKPKEASQAISALIGKNVSSIYVSNVKTLMKRKERLGSDRPVERKAGAAGDPNLTIDLSTLESVQRLVRHVGKATAKRLIDLFDGRPN